MAAQLANNLRVVLAAIVGSVDAIRGSVPVGAETDQQFGAIDGAIDTAFRLCQELTLLGAPARPDPVIVDINELILRIQPVLERVLGADIRLLLALDAQMPVIRADEAQLEWMLLNLAINGRDAMARGGVMTIQTSLVDSYQAASVPLPRRGYVRLTVSDTGDGISPQVRERAFEPFFSTRPEGAGLGLTSVALTVFALHGKLRIVDHQPAGTEVRVYLPLLDATPDPH